MVTGTALAQLASPRELFMLGWDTARIAKYWGFTEADTLRMVTEERCRALGLPLPIYEAAK